jgi:hypothetical protein
MNIKVYIVCSDFPSINNSVQFYGVCNSKQKARDLIDQLRDRNMLLDETVIVLETNMNCIYEPSEKIQTTYVVDMNKNKET